MPHPICQRFDQNLRGRDFVVGDIHGEFALLEHTLQLINFDEETDRVFSVGDLIDRGPESARAVEFLNKPWFFAVLGNHERMALDAQSDPDIHLAWTRDNGGAWWLKLTAEQREEHLAAYRALPMSLEIATAHGIIGVVHANVPTNVHWPDLQARLADDDYVRANILWSRQRYHRRDIRPVGGIAWVFCGHTPTDDVLQLGNVLYIDTGACYGGGLTVYPVDQLPSSPVNAIAI